jgi:hypothetical protein
MKRLDRIITIAVLVIGLFGLAAGPLFFVSGADEKGAVKAAPVSSILIPEVDALRWSNLRLDAQARQARSDALRMEAAALSEQADKFILGRQQELCKAAGVDWAQYDLAATKEGGLELRLKKPEPPKQ